MLDMGVELAINLTEPLVWVDPEVLQFKLEQ